MDTTRRTFLATALSAAGRLLVAVTGLSLVSGCPAPKYGGPPPGAIPPTTQPTSQPTPPEEKSKQKAPPNP